MSSKVSALIITGYGTNCEVECAHAARRAGADEAVIIHFSALTTGKERLDRYNFLIFPGGFLDGDDLGAAQAAAQRWQYSATAEGKPLVDQLLAFIKNGGLILGICNGFQLLAKLGLVPAFDGKYLERRISLAQNKSARYENRWCHLKVNPSSPCVFTRGLDSLYLPVRHGEGQLVAQDDAVLERLLKDNLVPVQYADPQTMDVTMEYPYNPNGSPFGIAGACDASGRIFGLMPHPEAFNHETNHPGWTRGEKATPGTALLANGVRYLRENG